MQAVAPTPIPVSETPAEFVARLGIKVDEAWRLWNEEVPRSMSRTAFREAARNPES